MQKTLVVATALFASSIALADSGSGDISAIMNGVSTESAQHEINANVEDWKNDIAQFTTLRDRACRDTKAEFLIWGHALVPSPVLVVSGVAAVPNGGSIQDEINSLQLAMRVSSRSYADAIETYKLRAEVSETYGKLDGVADRCNQYTLQIIRDNDMIAASQKLLALYAQADAAETAAIDQTVADQTKRP